MDDQKESCKYDEIRDLDPHGQDIGERHLMDFYRAEKSRNDKGACDADEVIQLQQVEKYLSPYVYHPVAPLNSVFPFKNSILQS